MRIDDKSISSLRYQGMVVQAGSGKNVKIDQKTEQNYNHAVDNSMLFKECVMQLFLH